MSDKNFDPRFLPRSSIVFSGSSNTGKTELLTSMIKNQEGYFQKKFDRIFCAHRVFQKAYESWSYYCPEVTFYRVEEDEIPDESVLTGVLDPSSHSLFVCDDLDDVPAIFPLLAKFFTTYW